MTIRKQPASLLPSFFQDQIKALIDAYQFFINPKVMRIGASQLRAVSRMPSKYPWCKIAPVIANIVTSNLMHDKLSNTCRSTAVPDTAVLVLKVKSIGLQSFAFVEEYITRIMKCYAPTAIKGLDSHTSLSPSCILFPDKLTLLSTSSLQS